MSDENKDLTKDRLIEDLFKMVKDNLDKNNDIIGSLPDRIDDKLTKIIEASQRENDDLKDSIDSLTEAIQQQNKTAKYISASGFLIIALLCFTGFIYFNGGNVGFSLSPTEISISADHSALPPKKRFFPLDTALDK